MRALFLILTLFTGLAFADQSPEYNFTPSAGATIASTTNVLVGNGSGGASASTGLVNTASPGANQLGLIHDGTESTIKSGEGRLWLYGASIVLPPTCIGLDVNSGGNAKVFLDAGNAYVNGMALSSDAGISFSSTGAASGASDGSIARIAPGVIAVGSGYAGSFTNTGGWLQQSAARARLTGDVTENAATLTNLTGLSVSVKAGRKYAFRYMVRAQDSTAAEGLKFDLDGGSATWTSIVIRYRTDDTLGALVGATTTAIATDATFATVTGEAWIVVEGCGVCNAAGTVILRGAQNTHATGTATFYTNSCAVWEDVP